MVDVSFLAVNLSNAAISYSIPLLLAALGGIVAERAGVLYFGQEGIMSVTAAVAILSVFFSNNLWLGLIISLLVGGAFGLLISFFSVNLQADQVMVGVALILGGAPLASWLVTATMHGRSIYVGYFQPLTTQILQLNILAYIALALVPITWYFLFKRKAGLRLRAVGEDPHVADSMGINVSRTKYYAVVAGSALVAFGGAYLTIGITGTWQGNPVSGAGILAIAIVRISNWKPQWALVTALIFGLATAVGFVLQAVGLPVAAQLLQALPYIAGLACWAAVAKIRKWYGPRALGLPYSRQ